ncbi:DUF58 domain-containing protein [Sorangium cellulosum]|uniref:DUF58 domain-containing protein n=1 Tax=Sorangium cellulosum So0157-2 TaxID=1254432 RepID=S4XP39_SORCE|nr:DUF58 domain-containing protein [Sorangium cellulosum]AGP33575.1 hypothetical protein SCE1572_03105 [Sorangium cellulosum So0157-2]
MPLASDRASLAAFPIDWGGLAPLRLKSRAVAEGVYAGMHRSIRKGAGVEFGGQRPYVPGDDLRFFDRRALLRHDRLMVREFETETDRALWLCVDATASMSYRGRRAPGAKLAYAALIAAAMARVALATGDPVGLAWLGGAGTHGLPAMAGREAFERIVGALEATSAAQDWSGDAGAIERALAPVAKKARRGAVVLLISDLLDLAHESGAERALSAFTPLSTGGRTLIALQVLDPSEAELDFEGNVRLRALEGGAVVEADAGAVRAQYKARLAALGDGWARALASRGGRLLRATSADPPTDVVRALVQAIAEVRR